MAALTFRDGGLVPILAKEVPTLENGLLAADLSTVTFNLNQSYGPFLSMLTAGYAAYRAWLAKRYSTIEARSVQPAGAHGREFRREQDHQGDDGQHRANRGGPPSRRADRRNHR